VLPPARRGAACSSTTSSSRASLAAFLHLPRRGASMQRAQQRPLLVCFPTRCSSTHWRAAFLLRARRLRPLLSCFAMWGARIPPLHLHGHMRETGEDLYGQKKLTRGKRIRFWCGRGHANTNRIGRVGWISRISAHRRTQV
jgi:hypothetical protein